MTKFFTVISINIFFLYLLLLTIPVSAQIYVAPDGDDLNAGTFELPLKNISIAVSKATAGDTIYVRGGIYNLTATISISKSGTAGKRLHIFAYQNERPLLDFSSMAVGGNNRGINLNGSWWYIKGIDIKGAGDNGMFTKGSNNIIEFCSFFENKDTGLQLGGGASNNQVINCDSYYNADPSHGNADGFAPKLDVGTNNYFYGCRAWQNSDDGTDGYMRGNDDVYTTFENCWVFNNGYLKDGTPSNGNGNGFKMGGSDDKNLMQNVILINCLAFDNRVKGFDQNNNRGSMTLYNCTAYRNGSNYSLPAFINNNKTASIINSVSLGYQGSIASHVVQQTNSWLSPFIVTEDDFISIDTAGVRGPRKQDGSLPDIEFMHPASGSDLIDAGTDIGLPFLGNAPNLGAFENGLLIYVRLTSFYAAIKEKVVQLFWTTVTEADNIGFQVERKDSSDTWEEINFVQGEDSSFSIINYFIADTAITANGKYYYRLKQISGSGSITYSNELEVDVDFITSIGNEKVLAYSFELSQNFPNPFNPATTINFSLSENSEVSLSVYNTLGELVSILINNELYEPGIYKINFNANLPSGVYIYRLQQGQNALSKTMLLLK